MHPVIQKTLGGLSASYYLRQFLFGLAVAAVIFFLLILDDPSMPFGLEAGLFLVLLLNTLLYPYSRFVFESVADFLMGDNVFLMSESTFAIRKVATMFLCWILALLVAPIGLAYLYYRHSKDERLDTNTY